MFEGKGLRIVLFSALAVFIAVILFLFFRNQKVETDREQAEERVQEITQKLEKAMEEMLELEVLSDDREDQIVVRETMLREKIAEVTSLKQRIRELKRQGLIDEETIAILEEKVDELETQLGEMQVAELDYLYAQVRDRNTIIDSMRKNSTQLRSEIEALRNQLEEANIEPVQVDPLPGNQVKNPTAANFKFYNLAGGDRVPIAQVKASDLGKMEICFEILADIQVPIGQYTLYMEYIHPNGEGIATAGSPCQYTVDGVNKLCTTQKTIAYSGEKTTVCMPFSMAGESFKKGRQRVVIYCNEKNIGEDTFVVQ